MLSPAVCLPCRVPISALCLPPRKFPRAERQPPLPASCSRFQLNRDAPRPASQSSPGQPLPCSSCTDISRLLAESCSLAVDSHCGGFSYGRTRAHGLSSCGARAQLPHGTWDLSSQTMGQTSVPLTAMRFLTTGPPGKSLSSFHSIFPSTFQDRHYYYCHQVRD